MAPKRGLGDRSIWGLAFFGGHFDLGSPSPRKIDPAAGQDLARSLCATALPIRQYVCGSFFRQGSFVLLQFAGADPSILRVCYRVGALARHSMDPLGV